jgi:hypothetical protein
MKCYGYGDGTDKYKNKEPEHNIHVPARISPSTDHKCVGCVPPLSAYFCPYHVIWSKCPVCIEVVTLGSPLSFTLHLPSFSIFPLLFPPLGIISGPTLPLSWPDIPKSTIYDITIRIPHEITVHHGFKYCGLTACQLSS